MRIAIPTNDMTTVSAHFGRSKGFMVYDLDKHKVTNFQYILNTFTGHAKNRHKEEEHGKHNHNHDSIFTALINCNTVIARGMGKRLLNEFAEKNIDVFITKEESINKTVDMILQGNLDHNPEQCCNH